MRHFEETGNAKSVSGCLSSMLSDDATVDSDREYHNCATVNWTSCTMACSAARNGESESSFHRIIRINLKYPPCKKAMQDDSNLLILEVLSKLRMRVVRISRIYWFSDKTKG